MQREVFAGARVGAPDRDLPFRSSLHVLRLGLRHCLIALCIVAPTSGAALAESRTVQVGDVSKVAPSWPFYVAADNGFFAAEGLAPETTYVGTDSGVIQQVVGGSLEIGITTYQTSIVAIDRGAPIRMIASGAIKTPYSMLASPNIKTPADLRGKSAILPFAENILTGFWNQWEEAHGLEKGAVDQVYDGSSVNRYAALSSGAVAAAALTQPFDVLAISKGDIRLLDFGTYAKNVGFTAIVATRSWLAKNPDVAKRFLSASAKAVQFLYDPANRDACLATLIKETKIDPALAAQIYTYYTTDLKPFSPTLALPDNSITGMIEQIRHLAPGSVGNDVVSRYVDASFQPQ